MTASSSSSGAKAAIDPSYLLPGTQVGPYVIEGRLGAGGMGATYRVRRDDEVPALKMATFSAEISADERKMMVQRFRREVGALIGLDHPNIVSVRGYDVWPSTHSGFPYLVMDYVAGLELYSWLRQAKPSVRRIVQVFRSTAWALHEVHRLGILHRDLKSANLLVREADEEPVLIDFGISRPSHSKTVTRMQTMLGTYTHFAPEYCLYLTSRDCLEGVPFQFTPQTELWAIGLMLYACLAGRPAFPVRESEAEMTRTILRETPRPPSQVNPAVPGALDEVVAALLEKNPDLRISTAELLAERLSMLLEQHGDASWDEVLTFPIASVSVAQDVFVDDVSAVELSSEIAPVLSEVKPSLDAAPKDPDVRDGEAPKVGQRPPLPLAELDSAAVSVGFSPPTVGGPRFVPPVAPAIALPKADSPGGQLSFVRQLAKKLEGSGEAATPRSRAPIFVVGGLLALVAGILGLAAMGEPEGVSPTKPRTLLQQVQDGAKRSKAEEAAPAGQQHYLSPQGPPAVVEAADSVVDVLPASAVPRSRRSGDEAAIDAELEAQFGRPVIPGPGVSADGGLVAAVVSPLPSQSPSWLQRPADEPAAPPRDPSVPPVLGVPLGARMKARLSTNLDSRTVGDGPVEAVLVRPFIHDGKVLLPARTVLYGQGAAGGNGRFTVAFSKLKLPNQTVVPVDALAFDMNDRKPGLRASRIIAAEQQQEGVSSKVAKGTANVLLGVVSGGTGAEVVRNAGTTVVNQDAPKNGYAQDALLLDGGGDFEVFVQSAF